MIEIGQDLVGEWAWIIRARDHKMVTSGCYISDRMLAAEIAIAVYRGLRSNKRLNLKHDPIIIYPDEQHDQAMA
jgi:hypothetical protein